MDSLSDDNIFELMKHLGRANFAFRATCHRMWDLFAKYRHILEAKKVEIVFQKEPQNWTIRTYNSLFPDYIFYAWSIRHYNIMFNIHYHQYSGEEINNNMFRMGIFTSKNGDRFYCNKGKKNNKFYCVSFIENNNLNGTRFIAKLCPNGDAEIILHTRSSYECILNPGSINFMLQYFINDTPIEKYLGPVIENELKPG